MIYTEVESDHPQEGLGWIGVGATDGDAAGMVYITTQSGTVFLGPEKAKEALAGLKKSIDQAKIDAEVEKVTINVAPGATDEDIISAVRSKLGAA